MISIMTCQVRLNDARHGLSSGSVPTDPKDEIITASALESKISEIISEDNHLLDLQDYQGLNFRNREEFDWFRVP